MEILLNNKHQFATYEQISTIALKQLILEKLGFGEDDFYLVSNGKRLHDEEILEDGRVNIVPRLCGGKGGFGSMLRAIGAQIEKTTNREACRDLSGRRLRDINEEQRLKNWITQQAEREKEAAVKRKKKLERLCEKPKHEFNDEDYDKERSTMPEQVEDAVLQGMQAACSSKRKTDTKTQIPKKKPKALWFDDDLEDLDVTSDDESEDEAVNVKQKISDDSKRLELKNESLEEHSKRETVKSELGERQSNSELKNKSEKHLMVQVTNTVKPELGVKKSNSGGSELENKSLDHSVEEENEQIKLRKSN